MRPGAWIGVLLVLGTLACGQQAPAEATAPPESSPAAGSNAPGYEANSTGAVADLSSAFATVQQASQLRITANATPPGATGANVQSISIIADDTGGMLKSLDTAGKQSLGNALLNAAATEWPNATISLLVSNASGGGGTIIGSRPQGGQNTVIAT